MQASFPPLMAVALPLLHAHSPKALPLFTLLSRPCTPRPEPQGPPHLCSATTFPCDLGQVPEPQGAATGSGSKNPSRQAAQSQAEPDISKTRAQVSSTSTAPSSRPSASSSLGSAERQWSDPSGGPRLPHTGGSTASLSSPHATLRFPLVCFFFFCSP